MSFRTIDTIRAELEAENLSGAPWQMLEDDAAEREAERRHRLAVEIEEWCLGQSIARIKLEYNPVFEKVGLHLVRLPRSRR